jgi:hypothetical protein
MLQLIDTLPDGHNLFEYSIERVLGQGGFGTTYLCRDGHLQKQVVIKDPKFYLQGFCNGNGHLFVVDAKERKKFTTLRRMSRQNGISTRSKSKGSNPTSWKKSLPSLKGRSPPRCRGSLKKAPSKTKKTGTGS